LSDSRCGLRAEPSLRSDWMQSFSESGREDEYTPATDSAMHPSVEGADP
jgi:hypothetical protein